MSNTRASVPWPGVAALRDEFAERAMQVAESRQAETGWTDEETVSAVRVAAGCLVDDIARTLLDAAEMALDVWEVTR